MRYHHLDKRDIFFKEIHLIIKKVYPYIYIYNQLNNFT